MTNQNGQLKTLQRQTMTSLIILCLCLTKQAITAKGADCRRRPPGTNTNKHTLQTPLPCLITAIPPTHTTKQTHTVRTHTHCFFREKHKSVHTRISPLLCLSLPDETNRTLIHKMEGKNALVCNHWLLHRLGGWIKGQSNIISWYRPWLHTNYCFKGKHDYRNLTVHQCI